MIKEPEWDDKLNKTRNERIGFRRKDVQKLVQRMRKLEPELKSHIANTIEKETQELHAEIKSNFNTRVGKARYVKNGNKRVARKSSGILKRAIKIRTYKEGLRAQIGIFSTKKYDAYYAWWVNYGTQSHNLSKGRRVRKDKRKKNMYGDNSRQHPGAKPTYFISDAVEGKEKQIDSNVGRAVTHALKKTQLL